MPTTPAIRMNISTDRSEASAKSMALVRVATAATGTERTPLPRDHGAHIKEQTVERVPQRSGSTIPIAEDENQRAGFNGEHPQHEHDVGRTEDFDVEAVGAVPPIVEGRRR